MKKILSVTHNTKNIDIVLLVIRIVISFLMLTHGIPKLIMLINGGTIEFPNVLGMGPELSLILAVFAEVFCSMLVLVGLGTRLAVIPLIITMLVASLIIHSSDPFSVKELSLHYLLIYGLLLFSGSGRFSIDGLVLENLQSGKNKRFTDRFQLLSNK